MSVNDRDREGLPPGPIAAPTGRVGGGFADLAKLAHQTSAPNGTQPSTEHRSENSGIIDLAALAAAEGETAPAAQPPAPAADAPAADAPAAKIPAVAPSKTTPTRRGAPLWAAFLLGAVVALGAVAFVLFLRRQEARPHGTSTTPSDPGRNDVVATQNGVSPVPGPVPIPSLRPAAAPSGERTVDFSQLPPTPAAVEGTVPSAAGARAEGLNRSVSAQVVAPAPSAAASASRAAGRASGGGEKGLDELMQEAVGTAAPSVPARPATPPDDTASTANAEVPFKPSQGAVNGALGVALPSARACLEPDSPISRARITFRSDGAVSDVVVEGWAAGKPVEACIRAALGKARVPPFAQPTYSVPATIRSN